MNGSVIAETAAETGTKNGNAVAADLGSAGGGHVAERRMNGNVAENAAKIKTGSASAVAVPENASGNGIVTGTRRKRCQKWAMSRLRRPLLARWV